MAEAKERGRLLISEKNYFDTAVGVIKSSLNEQEKGFFDKHSEKYIGTIGMAVNYSVAGANVLAEKGIRNVIKSVKEDYKKDQCELDKKTKRGQEKKKQGGKIAL